MMKNVISKNTEAQNFSVKVGQNNKKVSVRRSGEADSVGGKAVYVTSIDVTTAVDRIHVEVHAKGSWGQIKEKHHVVGWEFIPAQGTRWASVTIRLEE